MQDVEEAESTLEDLMGANVAPRKALIEAHGSHFSAVELDI